MKKVKAVLFSLLVMAAVSTLILALTALVISKMGSLPKSIAPILTTLSGCLAVFLGGFTASLYAKESGLLLGLASGLVFCLCLALVTLFLFQGELGISSIGKGAAVLFSGSLGGILGVNKKSKVKF